MGALRDPALVDEFYRCLRNRRERLSIAPALQADSLRENWP
jgi:hypothetical protein